MLGTTDPPGDSLGPGELTFDLGTGSLKCATNQRSARTVLSKLILHASAPVGICNLPLQLIQFGFPRNILRAGEARGIDVVICEVQRLDCQCEAIVFKDSLGDPTPIKYSDGDTVLRSQGILYIGAFFVSDELVARQAALV